MFHNAPKRLWFADRQAALGRVAAIGRDLASILLPTPVLSLLVGSLGALGEGCGLCVRLCLDPALIDLPWEFLYRPDLEGPAHLRGFLALDPRISLVREAPRLETVLAPSTDLERLLFAGTFWSGPKGLSDSWGVGSEYKSLCSALRPLAAYLKPIFRRSDQDLREVLASGAAVVHYSGHTVIEGETGYLERIHLAPDAPPVRTEDGRMSSAQFGTLLRQARTRLAVFSACNSGRWEFVGPLLENDLRAFIGVQELVSVSGAAKFSHALYSTLAIGLSLDEAVSWGRAKVLEDDLFAGLQSFEWGAFMVYMPSADGILLPRPAVPSVLRTKGEVQQAIDKTIHSASPPLPESVRTIESLCALMPGQFETVITGLELTPANIAGLDQHARANAVYRLAHRAGKLELLQQLIRHFSEPHPGSSK
jgi:hypothetical protein